MHELLLTHALVLTQFEASLTPCEWSILVEQDYPIHFLYCTDTGAILLHADNQTLDCAEEISKIQQTLVLCGIPAKEERRIVILKDDENCYEAQDVLRHLLTGDNVKL